MAETKAKDISRWQGAYSETGEPIVLVKISGGDDGLYYDSMAGANYNAVIAHGHAFGGYHFAGGTDPVAEANFFVNGMKPLLKGEVPILDWEISNPDPVGWCERFINQVEAVTGDTGGIIYMNLSTLRAHDWSRVTNRWGLWLADWNNNPEGDIDTGGIPYVMQQYNDGPNYDHDMFYGTVDQFRQYGWGYPVAPTPAPPTPTPPAPVVTTKDVTSQNAIPFESQTVEDATQPTGYLKITQAGVNGIQTIVTRITYTDGVQTKSEVISDSVTTAPVPQITTVGTKQPDPTPTPDPTPDPTPTPPSDIKKTIIAVIAAVAAAVAALIAWLHS